MDEKETKDREEKEEEQNKQEGENQEQEQKEETKEKTLEEKFKELEEKYNKLLQDKVIKDREAKHDEAYKKYDLGEENIKLLKRYLADKEDIEEELKTLNKDFPHLFNKNKATNINNSLDVKDFKKEDKEENKIDGNTLGMVG